MRKFLIVAAMLLAACHQSAMAEKPQCEKSGCSGQICADKGTNAVTTCEWREEYGCYKQFGRCEVQPDNHCGWTPTPNLMHCIDQAKSLPHIVPQVQ